MASAAGSGQLGSAAELGQAQQAHSFAHLRQQFEQTYESLAQLYARPATSAGFTCPDSRSLMLVVGEYRFARWTSRKLAPSDSRRRHN